MSNYAISKITYCPNITLVTLPSVPHDSQIISRILTAISDNGINVDMISQTAPQGSNIGISFTISSDSIGALLPIVNSFKPEYPELRCDIMSGAAKINFYDANMVNTPGVAAGVFSMLSEAGVQVYMITTSTVDISLLVLDHELEPSLTLCREKLKIETEEVPFE